MQEKFTLTMQEKLTSDTTLTNEHQMLPQCLLLTCW